MQDLLQCRLIGEGKMRAVVTGGAGFIGSHLTERLLKENHEVIVIDAFETGSLANLESVKDHPSLTIYEQDIRQREELPSLFKGVDWVFHLAALGAVTPSLTNPAEYFDVNVTGTLNVLESARIARVKRFIYTASCSCYASCDFPVAEASLLRPKTPYALTKYLGEELVMHWSKVYALPGISLRLFNVYGPRANAEGPYGGVVGVFLKQRFDKQPLTVVGDGKQTRDFIFVSDVVDAYYAAALSRSTGEIFNVGSSATTSINHLAQIMQGDVSYIPKRPDELEHSCADISKIKKMLLWQPQVSIEEGISSLFAYI